MLDAPLLSPKRLWLALRRWVWWGGDQGMFFPFWYFLRFEGRPAARARSGIHVDIWYCKTPWEG